MIQPPTVDPIDSDPPNSGIFDGFLVSARTSTRITGQSAFRGERRDMGSMLPYDPKSHLSMVGYIDGLVGPLLLGELAAPRSCAYCRRNYYERENIGQFKCSYHPRGGILDPDGKFLCCDKRAGTEGCRTADHRPVIRPSNSMWTPDDCQVKIPKELALRYSIRTEDPAVVKAFVERREDPARSYLVVSRVGPMVDREER